MKWEDYRQTYLKYELSVTQTRLISVISNVILKDFPRNVPKDIAVPAFAKLSKIFGTIAQWQKQISGNGDSLGKEAEKGRRHSTRVKNDKKKQNSDLWIDDIFDLTLGAFQRGMKLEDINFQRILHSQELITHHSNFEGILADSLRAICYVCPSVMKSRKTIEMEVVFSCSGWKELLATLAEKFVRDMGWGTIEEKLAVFTGRLNLEIQFEEDDMESLREIDFIRNLIVHNGGRANEEYVKLKEMDGLKIGDYISLDEDYLKMASTRLKMVASEIHIETSKKYFGKKEDEVIEGIWTRRNF